MVICPVLLISKTCSAGGRRGVGTAVGIGVLVLCGVGELGIPVFVIVAVNPGVGVEEGIGVVVGVGVDVGVGVAVGVGVGEGVIQLLVLKLQLISHRSVPPAYPRLTQVVLLRFDPSQSSPLSTIPSPQTPILIDASTDVSVTPTISWTASDNNRNINTKMVIIFLNLIHFLFL